MKTIFVPPRLKRPDNQFLHFSLRKKILFEISDIKLFLFFHPISNIFIFSTILLYLKIFTKINCYKPLKMLFTTKVNSCEICKPYLSHQRKYLSVKCLKNRFAKISSL